MCFGHFTVSSLRSVFINAPFTARGGGQFEISVDYCDMQVYIIAPLQLINSCKSVWWHSEQILFTISTVVMFRFQPSPVVCAIWFDAQRETVFEFPSMCFPPLYVFQTRSTCKWSPVKQLHHVCVYVEYLTELNKAAIMSISSPSFIVSQIFASHRSNPSARINES